MRHTRECGGVPVVRDAVREGEVGGGDVRARWLRSGVRMLGSRGGDLLARRRPCPCCDKVRRDAGRGEGGAGGSLLALLCFKEKLNQ